jgi:hypothetical protein
VDQQALEAGCSETAKDRRAADQQERASDAERYICRGHDANSAFRSAAEQGISGTPFAKNSE